MTDHNRTRRITIRQVAQSAGVSVSAVSKVLRDAYGVSPALRARVLESITQLDYRPLTSARGLRGRTYSVGVVLPDIRNSFFAEIINGLAPELRARQYQLVMAVTEAGGGESAVIQSMLDRQVDGIVAIGSELPQDQLETLSPRIPLVALGYHAEGSVSFDTVNNDDRQGARLATRHLLSNGFEDVAMLSLADTKSTIVARREQGYRLEMEVSGMSHYSQVVSASQSADGIRTVTGGLLASARRPSALFCWCDLAALHVIGAVLDSGLSVPDDLAIVGYDNSEPCGLPQNALTSIDQSGRWLGEQAAALLIERIEGRRVPAQILAKPKIAIRGSTERQTSRTPSPQHRR